MAKPTLCLDFDGVMHSYTSGWKGAAVIPDPPVPGLFNFLLDALREFRVVVFSSRSGQPGGADAMRSWLHRHYQQWLSDAAATGVVDVSALHMPIGEIEWVRHKPPAMVTLDDRAVTFTGEWPQVRALLAFKPWNQR